MARRRSVLFALLTLLLSLLGVELGVRGITAIRTGAGALTYGIRADREFRDSVNRHDETRKGYSKFRPHQRVADRDPHTGERFVSRINVDGFRGDEFGPKRPDEVRVVALGASSTFGFHNRDHETWPAHLESELARACPDHEWRVLNLGIPHLMSDEIEALFRAEGIVLDPDVVVFYEGINDASPRRERQRLRRRLHSVDFVRGTYRAVRERLLVVRFLDEVIRPRVTSYDAAGVQAHLADRERVFFESLESIRSTCESRGIRFLVVTQQAKSYLVDDGALARTTYAEEEKQVRAKLEREGSLRPAELWFLAHAGLMRTLRTWAPSNRVTLVDGIGALDGHRDELTSWVHLTAAGNAILARTIAGAVARPYCPEGSSAP